MKLGLAMLGILTAAIVMINKTNAQVNTDVYLNILGGNVTI